MSLRNSAVAVHRKDLIQDLKSAYCFAKVSAVAITRPLLCKDEGLEALRQ